MDKILGIKFRDYGQVYYFLAGEAEVSLGDRVIVETDQGQGIGEVIAVRDDRPSDAGDEELQPILRVAEGEDLERAETNEAMGAEAAAYCRECIRARNLDMKLVDVEVFFDLSKLIFYFTAPSRIDFRELVKDLVKHYRTRIELRQIGVRHETQMIGAVGNCGMVCCCRRYLRKFAPVTIKMAKEQNLFLNPAKISGICGRLLCCLSYEQENYEEFHRSCPRLGKKYMTNRGPVKVLRANMFRNSLMAFTDTGEEIEISLDEWQQLDPRRPDQQPQQARPPRRDRPEGGSARDGNGDRAPAPSSDRAAGATGGEAARHGGGRAGERSDRGGRPDRAERADRRGMPHGDVPGGGETPPAGGEAEADAPSLHAAGVEFATEQPAPFDTSPDGGAVMGMEQVEAPVESVPQAEPATTTAAPVPTDAALADATAAVAAPTAGGLEGPLAKQAPAAIALPHRQIKSTDASALRSSRGRRKRKRRPRDGGSSEE